MPELTPEERERIYQKEKARIEAREALVLERAALVEKATHEQDIAAFKKRDHPLATALYVAGLLFAVYVAFIAMREMPGSAVSSHGPHAPDLALGSVVRIDGAGKDALVYRSNAALEEASKAAAADDKQGFDEIAYSSQAFFVSDRTAAKILGSMSGGGTKVRIMEGPHAGENAYTNTEFLKSKDDL